MGNEMIDDILKKAGDLIQDACKEKFTIKSLWLFRHVIERKVWKTWAYLPIDDKVKDDFIPFEETVYSQEILEGAGSIGRAFDEFKESKSWLFIHNTFSAIEGTVIETDLKLGHKDVWFIPFVDADKETVISFMLLSLKFLDKSKRSIEGDQERVNPVLNNDDELSVGRLMRFAYHSVKNGEAIDSIKLSQIASSLDFNNDESPDSFLTQYLLTPLKSYYQSSSLLPVIKIVGNHLSKPIFAYSDVVFDILKRNLSNSIKNEEGFLPGYLEVTNSELKTFEYNGENVRLVFQLNTDSERMELVNCIDEVIVNLSSEYSTIQEAYIPEFDLRSKSIVEKKYITEQLCHKCEAANGLNPRPYYLILKEGKGLDENEKEFLFPNELVTCDIKSYVEKTNILIESILGDHRKEFKYDRWKEELTVSVLTDSDSNPFEVDTFIKDFIDQRYLYYKIFIERRHALQEANKSSKAAIMARNMSHNLGSHVMAYLKQHMSSVANILQDNVLAELFDHGGALPNTELENIPLPFLVGVGNFISYLQERQDFIATIATDYIPSFATVNFKDFIYDELNPDKRFIRHQDRQNLKPDNILLGNIARSEGLGREICTTQNNKGRMSDIVLRYRAFDGDRVENEAHEVIKDREKAYASLEEMRKIEVSLPGGVVGRQAVFSIIENIIRNAAKHGKWRDKGELDLTFDILDLKDVEPFSELKKKEAEYHKKFKDGEIPSAEETADYEKDVLPKIQELTKDGSPENLSLLEVLWLFYSEATDAKDLYFVTITDNISIEESAVRKLKDALNEDYTNDEGGMNEGNKGMKELRISAAWLRGVKDESEFYHPSDKECINEPQSRSKAPLMYARIHDKCLQYIFCLQKPRKLALVAKEGFDEDTNRNLLLHNWRAFTEPAFKKEQNKSYDFIICEDDDIYMKVRPYSPSITYKISDFRGLFDDLLSTIRVKKGNLSENFCDYERHLYEYIARESEPPTEKVCIDDSKALFKVRRELDRNPGYAIMTESSADGSKSTFHIKDVNIDVTDGLTTGDYLYRTHHETFDQFQSFMASLERDKRVCLFVEGVTGNTSTDRLIRNEVLDFKWYYSHLHAMKTKIAVFDERLFSKVYGLEEVNFTKGKLDSNDFEKKKGVVADAMPFYADYVENDIKTDAQLNKFIQERFLDIKDKLSVTETYTKDNLALAYFQKGICFFTFIKDVATENSYGLYGLRLKEADADVYVPEYDKNRGYACICAKLADVSWNEDDLSITHVNSSVESEFKYSFVFDYISIHQGLLDKLYEVFPIKDDVRKRNAVTTKISSIFGKLHNVSWESGYPGFTPGLVIHSGRSKPAKEDMPQCLPFLQYSAIEHAVLDCKLSLVNLLEDARYEPEQ